MIRQTTNHDRPEQHETNIQGFPVPHVTWCISQDLPDGMDAWSVSADDDLPLLSPLFNVAFCPVSVQSFAELSTEDVDHWVYSPAEYFFFCHFAWGNACKHYVSW